MVPVEIRVEDRKVAVRRFGTGDPRRWEAVRPGDVDRLTGRSFDELLQLGSGVWGFEETANAPTHSPAVAPA